MYKLLSYINKEGDLAWPGAPTVKLTGFESIKDGDACNTFRIEIFNHFGSHMDAPKHFNDSGESISDFSIDNFIYESPVLVDIPKSFGELVTKEEILKFDDRIKSADLLMIRSGFAKYRIEAAERYSREGPGVSAEAAELLVKRFPRLKAIGLDWISLASFTDINDGILAHQRMLGKFGDKHIFIIEDLNFDELNSELKIRRVFALPLMVSGIDSAPVTVVAEL